MLCFFDENHTRDDDTLWQHHVKAVEDCADRIGAAVTAVETLLRRVAITASVTVPAAYPVLTQRPWAALMGVVLASAGYAAAWAGRATWQALVVRDARRAAHTGRAVSWAILVLAAASATTLGVELVPWRDLIVVGLSLVAAIVGSWALQWVARRLLGLVTRH